MTTTDTLQVCEDCALWHANGDTTGVESPEREAAVRAYPGHLAIDCGENAEACDPFSWHPCDACGDRRGGPRHRAYAW